MFEKAMVQSTNPVKIKKKRKKSKYKKFMKNALKNKTIQEKPNIHLTKVIPSKIDRL